MSIAAEDVRTRLNPMKSIQSIELVDGGIVHFLFDSKTRSLKSQAYDASGVRDGGAVTLFAALPKNDSLVDAALLGNGNYLLSFVSKTLSGARYEFQRHTVVAETDGTIVSDVDVGSVFKGDAIESSFYSLAGGNLLELTLKHVGASDVLTQTIYNSSGIAILSDVAFGGKGRIDGGSMSTLSLADGRYVIAATSAGDTTREDGLYVQIYNSDGSADGAAVYLDSGKAKLYQPVQVTELANGGFAVNSLLYSQTGYHITEFLFDQDGGLLHTINNPHSGPGEQDHPTTDLLADGSLVTAWTEGNKLYFQHFDSSGIAIGAAKLVSANIDPHDSHTQIAVTGLSGGEFVVSWTYADTTYQRVYKSNGTALADANQVNIEKGDGGIASIEAGDNGSWTVTANNGMVRRFTLDSANHAPVALDIVVDGTEDRDSVLDGRYIMRAYDSDSDEIASFQITAIAGDGKLTLAGKPVAIGAIVTMAQTKQLKWMPDANANGDGLGTIKFKATDINGGVSANEGTITINVESISDAPVGANAHATVKEDGTYQLKLSDFAFSDADGDSLESIRVIRQSGTFLHNGKPTQNVDFIPVGKLDEYQWAPSATGIDRKGFTFRLWDTGEDSSRSYSRSYSFLFDVLDVPKAPKGHSFTEYMAEDSTHTFSARQFKLTDDDHDKLRSIIIETLPKDGDLRLAGKLVKAGQEIDVDQLDKLTFTPDKDVYGTHVGKFEFRLRDDGGTANGGADEAVHTNTVTFFVRDTRDTIFGTAGNDTIRLTAGLYDVDGRGGNDKIYGNRETNLIHGGDGDDYISGGSGIARDRLYGDDGNDTIYGEYGASLFGGSGEDTLAGEVMFGGAGQDKFVFWNEYLFQYVRDFKASGQEHDLLDIRQMIGLDSFEDLDSSHLYESNGDAVVYARWSTGEQYLVIKGVDVKDLTADHFIF